MNQRRITLITERLTETLAPSKLDVVDYSADHVGHAGAATGLGHFTVTIASDAFANHSLIDCHRMIYDALGDAMQTEIHALQINVEGNK